MNQKQIRAAVEAMLFACGEPISADKLAYSIYYAGIGTVM